MYENRFYSLYLGGESALTYQAAGTEESFSLSWPSFQINGKPSGIPREFHETGRVQLTERIWELTAEGTLPCGAILSLEARLCPESPILRFRYRLHSRQPLTLTKEGGEDLTYFSYEAPAWAERTEIRLSGYDYLIHGYALAELPAFQHEEELMGPILTEQRKDICLLTAYEHGSQYPDKFLAFSREEGRISLRAVKGNYWTGQSIRERPYETIWLQAGAVRGTKRDLAQAYREFQLSYCTLNAESRKPYLFYNTWAFQERNKFYNHKSYLASMNQERMEQEIETAHRMGVDVFVIDTGWYQKTGDWETDTEKFPLGLSRIKAKLDSYGMKLGLWFNPTVAAKSSSLLTRYRSCIAGRRDQEPQAFPVWETEESYPMCLVSQYWEAFADRLISLADTVGVRYFKWDAVDLYGCERGDHLHGGPDSAAAESQDCYAFQIGQYMSKVVDKLCRAHPDAIVDVDITEGRRYFGLGFLSSGKYFSMNNGPYFHDYDIWIPEDAWSNIFVHPGPARTWICRQNLCFDQWIPSVLMMAHYLPDDPESSQLINLASLVLGQNGVWGDLPGVSSQGVELFHQVLGTYKQVRDHITRAYPEVLGKPGDTFEVHEKIDRNSGLGVVCLFANLAGAYRYRMSSSPASPSTIYGTAKVVRDGEDVWLEAEFTEPGAAMVFFTEQ